ncbi:uncharacterized protein BX664DRAFT_344219 [Halteromyces radiatus]|uniref:uncharacterized protein n=1 Tax=Halteromyces radiatus TaxID=101107 RepID=UPI002220639A|nr:uncharacterized protein BX664DRAFT_344219 [Halteromyces radiatus]KAI8076907.1 hypothetical protein BX664DRAFT_344219 [Halteromyces radiatus]
MGNSHSKSHSKRKTTKATKAIKTTKNKNIHSTTTLETTRTPIPPPQSIITTTTDKLILPLKKDNFHVGIDMYTAATPSTLIRDHVAEQPLSSLFPHDIPLSEICYTQQQSTANSYSSSTNSSTVSTLSDLFSSASIDTPVSTLSTTSRYTKHSTLSTHSTLHVPHFGHGPSSTTVTLANEESTKGISTTLDDLSNLVHVAQSKIHSGHESLIQQGFQNLLYLAESRHCVDAFYPLAESYYLGHHHSSKQPDKVKALFWFRRVANISTSTSLPSTTIAWAQYRIAIMLAKGDHNVQPNVEEAVKYFKLSAERDNRYAQYMLGLHYQHGLFIQQYPDLKQALHWYERAARQGFSDAQVSLGQLILENLDFLLDNNDTPSIQIRTKWIDIAIHWLELAAKQKNVKAHITLGGLYEEGELVDRNATLAIQHYEAAISNHTIPSNDKQVILAHYFIGINYRLGNLVPQNHSTALKHLELASKGGYAPAQRALGLMYLEGISVNKNESIAYEWFTKAAMQGDVQALGLLGQQAERRGHSDADIQSAINMYKQAALSGSVTAQLSLAHLLLRTDRHAEAFPWFQLAATNDISSVKESTGDSTCMNKINLNVGHVRQRNVARLMVARYKFNGWGGVDINRTLAYQEFFQLSQEQFSDAYFWVAACYEEGVQNQDGSIIVETNPQKAFDYYMKSALAGDVDGQFHVALMLANGVSSSGQSIIEKDPVQAFKWYCKAAERGHPTAQYSLGLFYERGLSPVENVQLTMAKCWYERASHQHHTTSMISLAQLLLLEESTVSHQEALHWLHTAATKDQDKNYTAALRSLAGVFEQGKIAVVQSDPDRYQKGWLLLQKAADKGDHLAFVDMARYHEHGLGVETNIQNALECLIQSEKLGYQKARIAIADLYQRHDMWKEALESYQIIIKSNPLLKKAGWNARLSIGKILLVDGYDQEMDCSMLMKDVYSWLFTMVQQSAGAFLMEPLELLGICYEFGKGTNKDISQAILCYEKVIKFPIKDMDWTQERTRFRLIELFMQNDQHNLAWEQLQVTKTHFITMNHKSRSSRRLARTARFYLGYLLLHGTHMETNVIEAQQWLTQAADEGEGNAALELFKLHQIDNEMEEAKRRLDQGISAGHSGCMVEMALLLENDNGDRSDMIELLDRAIELGNTDAMYHKGRLEHEAYLDDPAKPHQLIDSALTFYMDAAGKGDRLSMVHIGQLYDGLGLFDDAQTWFEQSSEEPLSSIMLMMYHLQGMTNPDISGKKWDHVTFEHFLQATQNFWEQKQTTTLWDKIDRQTISNICVFIGQNHQTDQQEIWYKRAVDLSQHKDAEHALGLLCQNRGDVAGAMDWFRSAAEKWNHAPSQYQLGMYHAYGLGGLDINLVASQRYLKLASNQGLEQAKKELGTIMFMHAWDLWNNQKQYQRGLKQFEKAATLVPEALVELGHLYHTGFEESSEHGICVILKNYKQAFSYYSEAAQQGNAKAALMLGSYYEEGYLDMENLDDALKWYEKAYQWKCGPLAELAIGKLKHSMAEKLMGQDVEAALDLQEEAYSWFEGSVSSSSLETIQDQSSHAKVMMALYHLKGWGRKPCDPKKGFDMLMSLIQGQDNNVAISEIAMCYDQGIGVDQDINKALHYWELAAEIDDVVALRRTAEIYRLGLAGDHNLEKANEYDTRADTIEHMKQNEREKSFCSTSSSSSSSYASRRSSLNSLNSL